jgi:hypothetical protein
VSTGPLTPEQIGNLIAAMNDDASYEHIVVLAQAAARLGIELAADICAQQSSIGCTDQYAEGCQDCAAAIRERARK